MKVALINTYPHGGAGVACRRLAAALREAGDDVSMITREEAGSKWPFYAERLYFLQHERNKSVRFQFSPANFGTDLRKQPFVRSADIIHLHWINQGFLSVKNISQLGKLNKPVVWTLHDMWAFTGGCHYSGTCDRWMNSCGECPYLKSPSATDLSHKVWQSKKSLFPPNIQFVTCSAWLAGLAKESGLLRHHQVTNIPNPIDTNSFAPITDAERLAYREALGVPSGTYSLLFVAMKISDTRKGFHLLAESLNVLRQKYPQLPLHITVMGKSDPQMMKTLPYPVHSLGLVTEQNALSNAYAAADAFVIPSLEDNLPNTVMESLACGTPVIGFNTGGIPEMVTHGQEGFIARQGNAEELADGIFQILEGREPLSAYRMAARRKVMKHYANDIVAERYKALYDTLLKNQ